MPFQELVSRLKSVRKPRDQQKEPDQDRSPEGHLNPSQQTKPVPDHISDQAVASRSKPAKGLRKSSVSARLPTTREKAIDQDREQDPEPDPEPEPSDYLYFGEGKSATNISQSLARRTQSRPVGNTSSQPSTGTRTGAAPSSNVGKDSSGFIETGLNTHTAHMGYSNLTYGGALQYDYAGTHG